MWLSRPISMSTLKIGCGPHFNGSLRNFPGRELDRAMSRRELHVGGVRTGCGTPFWRADLESGTRQHCHDRRFSGST